MEQSYIEEFPHVPAVVEETWLAVAGGASVPISPATGSVLRFMAASIQARTMVDIETGSALCGLWMLQGAPRPAVITCVNSDQGELTATHEQFVAAGVPATEHRTLPGPTMNSLERLTDHAYDLVCIGGASESYPLYMDHALRLLRPGGIVVLLHALAEGAVADPATRSAEATLLRRLARHIREDPRLTPMLLSVGGGLLAAVTQPTLTAPDIA